MKVSKSEYAPFYHTYVQHFTREDPIKYLEDTQLDFFESIPSNKISYRYGKDKWTIAQVLGHLIDAERVFSYRALRIGRNDKTALAGFDENAYIKPADFESRPWISLLDEYLAVRQSTVALIKSFKEVDTKRSGSASGQNITVNGLIHIMAGHEFHHIGIIKERYL